uniref:Uncharacterized protein n=1 Tax=viral metagenome TaxID=1070528 RepID=A0A6C0KKL6_9ZZZZ
METYKYIPICYIFMENIHLDLSIEEIIKELDDKNLLYLTTSKIQELKNNILQKLYLTREELLHYHKVLKEYRYVDEIDEIKIGGYIRWFNLKKMDSMKLTNGGFIIDLKQHNENIHIICKNSMNRVFNMILNECIVFQKMNQQEKILIKIIDYASK